LRRRGLKYAASLARCRSDRMNAPTLADGDLQDGGAFAERRVGVVAEKR